MLKSLSVEGLNHQIDADLEFNEDLNVITGKNGSGKTTLLKLLWYLISGNLERIFPEIPFQSVSIQTDSFDLWIPTLEEGKIKLISTFAGEGQTIETGTVEELDDKLKELNRRIARTTKASLFFPTFRRIEGGFSGGENKSSFDFLYYSIADWGSHESGRSRRRMADRATTQLQEAISQLSNSVSVYDHKFIASISTHDIVELLREKYSDISDQTNALHVQLSKDITQKISEKKGEDDATRVLDDIQERVEQDTQEREALHKPFSVLTERIREILQYKGIRVSSVITLGEAEEAIVSDKLSAGEKQMLSFLCYNTFSESVAIFIDEPELSLHVDWQRLLLPTLLEQGTGNQFFIATHSPFIYSKYPDKEILLGDDRGAS